METGRVMRPENEAGSRHGGGGGLWGQGEIGGIKERQGLDMGRGGGGREAVIRER